MDLQPLNTFNSNTLSKSKILEFKRMLRNNKISLYLDDIVEDIVDEHTLMECLVYMWQQNSSIFRKNIPQDIKLWFLSKFTKSNIKFYKGMRFKKDVSIESLDDVEFTSVTIDYSVAYKFAFTSDIHCILNEDIKEHIKSIYNVFIFEVSGESCLNVDTYRDLQEKEYIIYKPKFKILEVL